MWPSGPCLSTGSWRLTGSPMRSPVQPGQPPEAPLPGQLRCKCLYTHMCIQIYICMCVYMYICTHISRYKHRHRDRLRHGHRPEDEYKYTYESMRASGRTVLKSDPWKTSAHLWNGRRLASRPLKFLLQGPRQLPTAGSHIPRVVIISDA